MRTGTVSLDLDNLWCYQRSFGVPDWRNYRSFLDIALPRVMQFLEQRQLQITFFVVGKDTENANTRALLNELVKAGHEIANHSYHHKEDFHQNNEAQIAHELEQAHHAISEATGQTPVGFRGPAFGISDALLNSLQQLEYQYDASTFPSSLGALARRYQQSRTQQSDGDKQIAKDKFGTLPNAWLKLSPHYLTATTPPLLEIPVTTSALLRFPCHGTYLNFVADRSPWVALSYFKMVLLGYKLFSVTPSFLLHATDFIGADDGFDLEYLPGMKRSSKDKIEFMHAVFDCLQKDYSLSGLAQFTTEFAKSNPTSMDAS
ncbi:polysaccharide deacetylase family protein [Aliiglaciecola litoralis]|uniref:Polysaccharide deacetylase family protein n=1 Tax=Aliiglaciecola litoralis TaxID=582857 RepID=A0ABP3WX03_9ALTE